MVDLHPTNAKLRDRTRRIFSTLTGVDSQVAQTRLDTADGRLKLALVMELCQLDRTQAQNLLATHNGKVKAAIRAVPRSTY